MPKPPPKQRTPRPPGRRTPRPLGIQPGEEPINAEGGLYNSDGTLKVPGPKLPPLVDAFDLIGSDLERPPELVEGILHRGSKMVIGGGSKSFKTWVLIDLAASVATGSPWWGFDTEQGKVLYMNFEIQDVFFRDRLFEVTDAKDCQLDPGQLTYWGLRGKAADLRKLMPKIVAELKDKNYSLIIFDPIYKGLGDRDENKAGDIASLLNELESLAVQTGAAVAFGHHFSKGNQAGKESIDRIGGSGVFARDPDAILTMTRHEEDEAFTVDATLRNFPPIPQFVVTRRHPLMVRDDALDPKALRTAGAPQKYSDEDLLSALDDEPLRTMDWFRAVTARIGISQGGFLQRRQDLARRGLVRQENKEWMREAQDA